LLNLQTCLLHIGNLKLAMVEYFHPANQLILKIRSFPTQRAGWVNMYQHSTGHFLMLHQ
jgi:hypothetical protein